MAHEVEGNVSWFLSFIELFLKKVKLQSFVNDDGFRICRMRYVLPSRLKRNPTLSKLIWFLRVTKEL